MAERSNVFTKAQVALGTSTGFAQFGGNRDVTRSVKSVELSRVFDMLDDTVMGETARSRKAGLEDVTATIEFVQTFAVSPSGKQKNIDEILSNIADISQSGQSVKVTIKPSSAPVSTSNPLYEFSAVLESHTPMSGAVGEILMTSVPFRSAGGSLARITVPVYWKKPTGNITLTKGTFDTNKNKVDLTWTASLDSANTTSRSVLEGHRIYRSNAQNTKGDLVAFVSAGTNTYEDTKAGAGLANGTYYYRVYAINGDGENPAPNAYGTNSVTVP